MNDEYVEIFERIDPNLIYTSENIPTEEMQHLFEEEFIGCDCTNDCMDTCACIHKSGAIMTNKQLNILNNRPIYECNINCKCNRNCAMKLVQNGPIHALKVIESVNKGFCLITQAKIGINSFICEYAGELITPNEASSRFQQYSGCKLGKNYIFWLKEFFGDSQIQTIIDPTRIGNIGRFINHSCEPNCDLIVIRINNLVPKLCIFANRKINESEEITFDYGCNESGLVIASEQQKIACFCAQIKCRKYLPFHNI